MNDRLLEEFLELVKVERFAEHYSQDISDGKFFGFPLEPVVAAERRLKDASVRSLAYFSMEYGLASSFYNKFSSKINPDPHNQIPANTVFSNNRLADYFFDIEVTNIIDMPIYSGGLGVLAGDTVKTMADYKLPAVAVGILWHSGYFKQKFWFKYGQVPEKMHWHPHSYPGLIPLENIISLPLRGHEVKFRLWKYYVYSYKHDYVVPLLLLDAEMPENNPELRELTDQLYRSDNARIKILQRLALGAGGVIALDELGYKIDTYHLNEGHAAFAFAEKASGLKGAALEELSRHFAYTCHTPVEAGHDRFQVADLKGVLSDAGLEIARKFGDEGNDLVNLTLLAMNVAHSVNAVSKRHSEVMAEQFPRYKEKIKYVTNGVHPHTWISAEFMKLYKSFPDTFKDVQDNPMILKRALELKADPAFRSQVWQAHQANKQLLCSVLEKWQFSKDVLTICWARRIAAYKRPSMIFNDISRLLDIAANVGPLQIILAGKAHPNDNLAFTYVNEMLDVADHMVDRFEQVKIVILENYDIYMGKFLTSCADIWLNNPLPPLEASGTSGMKAILNGVVQLSTVYGWEVEAQDDGIGRTFGWKADLKHLSDKADLRMREDGDELYKALKDLASEYYRANDKGKVDLTSPWLDLMINCIAAAGRFNTYRMLDEYKSLIWAR